MAVKGTARCTMKGTEEMREFEKVGPDGNKWELLGDFAVKEFCEEHKKLYHQRLAEHSGKHVCALFGTWGFKEEDKTTSVVFLRYEFRGSLSRMQPKEVFDPTTTVGIFGHELYKEYKKISKKTGQAHMWKRDEHGEIAVDFCVG